MLARISVLLLLLSSSAGSPGDSHQLELVQVIFRHGERVPYPGESYPMDPHRGLYTAGPPGQLSQLGRWRARRLGLALRRRYAELQLPEEQEDVYGYSADSDCSRASLDEVLEGLLGRPADARTHAVPGQLDVLTSSRDCSRFRAELDRLRRTAEVREALAKYEGLYTYLTREAGVMFDEPNLDEQLYKLHELLESQRSLNLTLPSWCTEGVLELFLELAFLHYNLESHTTELKRLNGGPLVRRFLEAMMTTESQARIQLYSGDGHNVAAFARAHGKRYPHVPNYGSAIIVEKWRASKGGVFARILIWTGVTEKLFPLQLRGCPLLCPIEDYKKIVAEVLPSDWEVECLIGDLKERISK